MTLKIYHCEGTLDGKPCPNKTLGFGSRRDANAEKIKDRPQCGICGTRV